MGGLAPICVICSCVPGPVVPPSHMRSIFNLLMAALVLTSIAQGTNKPHVITLGKWRAVKSFAGPDETQVVARKVRPLYGDGRVKEFALGLPHDVTVRLFVVRRAFRLNDALSEESEFNLTLAMGARQMAAGRLRLRACSTDHPGPEFDSYYSTAS
jgi:hypothetical protein